MKIPKLVLSILSLSLAANTQAAWQLYDDFEGANLLDKWIFTQADVGTVADSSVAIVVDPDAAGAAAGNHVMLHDPGTPYATDHRSRLINRQDTGFPAINYGTSGTAFFRWYCQTVIIGGVGFAPELDMNVGMSAVNVPTQYAESGPVTRWDVGANLYDAYNGDPNPANPASLLGFQTILVNRPDDVWVSQWYYVRNFDVANARQDYQIYIRVGDTNDTPQLVYPTIPGELAGFRAKPDGDLDPANAHLDVFYFTNSSGTITTPQGLDAAFFADDLYIDQNGLNLSDPVGGGGGGPATGSTFANISTRGEVLTGNKIMIAGFVISGTANKEVLIRAAGPSLGALGVTGTLAAPTLSLFTGAGTQIATNTGWGTAANAAAIATAITAVGAFEFATGSGDSALLVTLAPGDYTAQISGVGGTTGVVLAEVYQTP